MAEKPQFLVTVRLVVAFVLGVTCSRSSVRTAEATRGRPPIPRCEEVEIVFRAWLRMQEEGIFKLVPKWDRFFSILGGLAEK